jgi:hypothetical protein
LIERYARTTQVTPYAKMCYGEQADIILASPATTQQGERLERLKSRQGTQQGDPLDMLHYCCGTGSSTSDRAIKPKNFAIPGLPSACPSYAMTPPRFKPTALYRYLVQLATHTRPHTATLAASICCCRNGWKPRVRRGSGETRRATQGMG